MKTTRALLACACALLLGLVPLPLRAQDKMPVRLSLAVKDAVGQRVVFALRETLRRSAALVLVPDDAPALLTLHLVSMESVATNNGVETAYAVTITVNDNGAFTGSAYWMQVIGICGAAKAADCGQTLAAYLDTAAEQVQSEVRRRARQPLKLVQQ